MTTAPAPIEDLDAAVAAALGLARRARAALRDKVPGLVVSQDRLFPAHLAREIDQGRIFRDRFLADLHRLVEILRETVARGTHERLVPDPYDLDGGWREEVWQEPVAVALGEVLDDLVALARALDRIRDRVLVERVRIEFRA